MFDGIREGLIEAYKHKTIEGKKCVICGRERVTFALHVIEYSHDDGMPTPVYFVPMSQSRGRLNGSVPICHQCCPPCKKCDLPIATKWIAKIKDELSRLHPEISFRIGNGFCQHIHAGKDFGALFKKVRIDGADVNTFNRQKKQPNQPSSRTKPISPKVRQMDHELGMGVVANDLKKQGYSFQSVNRDVNKFPQMVVEKDGQIFFVVVSVDRINMPIMQDVFREKCLDHACQHNAEVLFAPVSLMPTGKKNEQGQDGFYVKYTGFNLVENNINEDAPLGLIKETVFDLLEQHMEAAKRGERIVNRMPELVRLNMLKSEILNKLNKIDRSQLKISQETWGEIDKVDLSGALGDIGTLYDKIKVDLPKNLIAKLELEARQEDTKSDKPKYDDIDIISGQ